MFGDQVLTVFRSNMPDMDYMCARKLMGFDVHFKMRGGQVVIRIQQNSKVLELIPQEIFTGDLPDAFIKDYVHWLDLSSYEIEFRLLDRRWTSSEDNWCLHYEPKLISCLAQHQRKLIDVRTATFSAVMKVFRNLESEKHTHVSVVNKERLEVHFPRLDICFFLDEEGHFYCRELRKIVDPDQSLGTLIGLSSRLIFCGSGKLARKLDRVVIIPDGPIAIDRQGSHVKVDISPGDAKVRLFKYAIDPIVQRLKGIRNTERYVLPFLQFSIENLSGFYPLLWRRP